MILRIVQIISEWQKLPEPFIEFRPLKQMSEKEQAELEKLQADKDQAVANTYKTYIDMGSMEPYEARFLQFGDSLDKIPVPEEDALPSVETVSEKEEDDPSDTDSGDDDDTDGPGDIEARIAELEEKEKLTEEEKKELAELKKQVENNKGGEK
jgi:hypothetical protein